MDIHSGLRLINTLTLQNQGKWRLDLSESLIRRAQRISSQPSFIIRGIGIEEVVAAGLGMTPNAVLKQLVPYVASTSTSQSGIISNFGRINGVWIIWHSALEVA